MYIGESDAYISQKDAITMHSLVFNVACYSKGDMEKFQ